MLPLKPAVCHDLALLYLYKHVQFYLVTFDKSQTNIKTTLFYDQFVMDIKEVMLVQR